MVLVTYQAGVNRKYAIIRVIVLLHLPLDLHSTDLGDQSLVKSATVIDGSMDEWLRYKLNLFLSVLLLLLLLLLLLKMKLLAGQKVGLLLQFLPFHRTGNLIVVVHLHSTGSILS